jgi:hypothetical protein
MQISYENNVDDIVALTAHQLETNSAYKKRRTWYIIGSPLLILLCFIGYAVLAEKYAYIAGGIAGALFSFVWYWRAYRNYPRKAVEQMLKNRPQKELFCRHTVTITNEGISEQTPESQCFQTWNALVDVAYTPGFIFVYVTPATAHIFPQRELGETLFQQVAEEIRMYWNA